MSCTSQHTTLYEWSCLYLTWSKNTLHEFSLVLELRPIKGLSAPITGSSSRLSLRSNVLNRVHILQLSHWRYSLTVPNVLDIGLFSFILQHRRYWTVDFLPQEPRDIFASILLSFAAHASVIFSNILFKYFFFQIYLVIQKV